MKGNLLNRNPTAEQLTTFVQRYRTEHFFKYIVTQIDFDKELDFETQTNGKEYSFVCKTIKDLGCINIYGRDTEQKKAKS
jgi:hypothetical protein